VLSLGVPAESWFPYGEGILSQCASGPPPFPQFDLNCHWFLLCMPPQFFI